MGNNEFINDKGLFLGQSDFNFSLLDSFETIESSLKTIKEYRDYANPDSPEWQKYIQEFFHILGFHTEQKAQRLISLSDSGTNGSPKALVMLISPGEKFDEIIPGLNWLSYLFYAANFHCVNWGFLTNGLEMRVFDFRRNDYRNIFLWANLDGIICDGRLDSFFTIYKVFSYIRGRKAKDLPTRRVRKLSENQKPVSSEYDLAYHTNNIPQSTVDLFDALRSKIFNLPSSIAEKCNKTYISYSSQYKFCEICILKSRLKVWVVLSIEELFDPHSLCRDVRNIGHYGTGNSEIDLQNIDDVDAVFEIVKQAYSKIV